jgi:hypothetical protein
MPPSLHRVHVSTLLLLLIEAGGDPGIFCYRMGVDILSAGRLRFAAPIPGVANVASLIRNQVACSNLFSTFSTRFTTLKD